MEVEAIREILWWTSENNWFEYPMGLHLLYFWFPEQYQRQALMGVPVYYTRPGPTSMKRQPLLAPDKKEVLRKKIIKFVAKGYIGLINRKIRSLIKYFAVHKGIINGIVQDWRTVFHARANKLNDCIWAPSFSLLMVNSLLQIVGQHTLMANRDKGEMCLNFHLHSDTVWFVGIDMGSLNFASEESNQRWMCWKCNLMGFKAPPYKLVHMYLVLEEIILGNHHDHTNAFQWNNVMLNLPGTRHYNPLRAWITKLRAENYLASNSSVLWTISVSQARAASG